MKNSLNVTSVSNVVLSIAATLILANCGNANKSTTATASKAASSSSGPVYVGGGGSTLPGSNTTPTTTTTTTVVPAADTMVITMYKSMLNREPAASDIPYWKNVVKTGSCADLMNGVGLSAEFLNQTESLSDTAFVERLYKGLLNRAPDAAGWNQFVVELTSLKSSMTARAARMTIVPRFATSQEAKNRCAAANF